MLRNIYQLEEESEEWQEIVREFPNGVPRFASKSECEEWMRKYSGTPSNPEFPELRHSITTLISWEQIEKYVLRKLQEFNSLARVRAQDIILDNNRFIDSTLDIGEGAYPIGSKAIKSAIESRLNLSIHQTLTHYSTINTLKYAYYHMRCGILVSIRQNQVVLFCPFVNKDFTNSWSDHLQVETNSLTTYFDQKRKCYREENILEKNQWWANGNIICAEHTPPRAAQSPQWWGDHFLLQLKDMFVETCTNRELPDCDFFINKRDYPQLKFNQTMNRPVEPYGFIFDRDDRDPSQDVPLTDNEFGSYAPFMSFYSSSRFTDLMIPTSEDWEAATGEIFPPTLSWIPKPNSEVPKIRDLFTTTNLKKFEVPWESKRNLAFFRGTATGGGVTVDTNQRLKIAQLCHEWEQPTSPYRGYLDGGIVGWNLRDKKISSSPMTFLRPNNFPFGLSQFTPIYEQSTYKYLLYVEGHCAACRYGFMMCLGSVILKVDSLCVADEMWYFPLLRPYVDHVPVKSDLSDLAQQIEWCRNNDEKCQEIAQMARLLHDRYITREGILDYIQMLAIEISKRTVTPLSCFSNPPEKLSIPVDMSCANRLTCCKVSGLDEICSNCKILKEQREVKRKLNEEEERKKKGDPAHRKFRDIMKKRKMASEKKDDNESGSRNGEGEDETMTMMMMTREEVKEDAIEDRNWDEDETIL